MSLGTLCTFLLFINPTSNLMFFFLFFPSLILVNSSFKKISLNFFLIPTEIQGIKNPTNALTMSYLGMLCQLHGIGLYLYLADKCK